MRSVNGRWRSGGPIERVVVIDRDLGHSGASATEQRLRLL